MFKKSLLGFSVFFGLVLFAHSASAYTPQTGDLLRTADDATIVLVMDDGRRLPVSAEGYAIRYQNNFGLVKTVTSAERGSYSSNLVLGKENSIPSGSVFMYDFNQPGIYLVQNGFKRLFSTYGGFLAGGYDLNNVQWIGQYTEYPTGAPVQ